MPHIEIKYDKLLSTLDLNKLFLQIETKINEIDPTAGACKSRAYPSDITLHKHCYLHITMLKKPHRNEKFFKYLLAEIELILKLLIPENTYYSIELTQSSDFYITSLS